MPATVLSSVGIPVKGIGIIIGVDRLHLVRGEGARGGAVAVAAGGRPLLQSPMTAA